MTISVNRDCIISKCNGFIEMQVWPAGNKIDYLGWLENFEKDEKDYAYCLLDAFTYFSEPLVDKLFEASFNSVLLDVCNSNDNLNKEEARTKFKSNCIVTYVTGEKPNPADSGYQFARKARKICGIDEEQILYHDEAIKTLIEKRSPETVIVFVDDFVGSGQQMKTTWGRAMPSVDDYSYQKCSDNNWGTFYYCPLVSTYVGLRELRKSCQGLKVVTNHILSDEYSVFSESSIVWPEKLKEGATNFIRKASIRAGICTDHEDDVSHKGFAQLGLTLAFADSVPDATLPLFYEERNGWQPLVRRT